MNPLHKQEGGTHYKDNAIQPVEYCQRNGLGFCESSVVKYVSRHQMKGKAQDIRKAIHFLELLLEIDYPPQHPEPLPELLDMVKEAERIATAMKLRGISQLGPIKLR